MSSTDQNVSSVLRDQHPLVVVEAPAGCGKTYQGSKLAVEVGKKGRGRVLVLTHTHAAANEFAARAEQVETRVDVRTIDSLITEIASAYHNVLGLPEDVGAWARRTNGYQEQAKLVAQLLRATTGLGRALTRRYPLAVFDEHQDATEDQTAIARTLVESGARVRIFGDPMQSIYGDVDASAGDERWKDITSAADKVCALTVPHRWSGGDRELGEWILDARQSLADRKPVDLSGPLPNAVDVLHAENRSARYGGYRTSTKEGRPIRAKVDRGDILILAAHNRTVRSLRSYFNRRIPLWEGHVRPDMDDLVEALSSIDGDPEKVAEAFVTFVQSLGKGFTNSRFGDRLIREVGTRCSKTTHGLPAKLQEIGRIMLEEPNHRGVSKALRLLWELSQSDSSFRDVEIDHSDEFWDAVRLGEFADPEQGLGEIARRRTWYRPEVPPRALSTIHKAKGLERDSVMIIACDDNHFKDREKDRCLMYVAMSRARKSLTLVVPRDNPTPLFKIS